MRNPLGRICLLAFLALAIGMVFYSPCRAEDQQDQSGDSGSTNDKDSKKNPKGIVFKDPKSDLARALQNLDATEEAPKEGGEMSPSPSVQEQAQAPLTINQEHLQYLDLRQKRMEREQQALEDMRKQIKDDLARLEKVKSNIDRFLAKEDKEREEREGKLIKMLESMEVDEANKILLAMDDDMALSVMSKMKSQKLAPILAGMDPARAARISKKLLDSQKQK
jgi:flagellar motility protein MotE (MotC chaperone)